MTTLTASVKKHGYRWVGVLRDERSKVVWECGHFHENRDCRGRKGKPARECADDELRRLKLQAMQQEGT